MSRLRRTHIDVTLYPPQYRYVKAYAISHQLSMSAAVRELIDFHKEYARKQEIKQFKSCKTENR